MEERLNDSTNLRLFFLNSEDFMNADLKNTQRPSHISVGETIALAVLAEQTGSEQKNISEFNSTIKRLSVLGYLRSREEETKNEEQTNTSVNDNQTASTISSNMCFTFVEGLENRCTHDAKTSQEARMLTNTRWMIPITITLHCVPEPCTDITLSLTVWLGETASKTGSETHDSLDLVVKQIQPVGSGNNMTTKVSFHHHLKISAPPSVDVSLVPVAGKFNIVGKVTNTRRQKVVISDCRILPQSCHWSTRPEEDQGENSNQVDSQDVITVTSNLKGVTIELQPCETYTFMFQLCRQGDSTLDHPTVHEVSLAVHLTWTFLPSKLKRRKSRVTTYLIPKISVRKPPFQVSTSCCQIIGARKSFSVTYDISNRLQDFLALKLYWSPEKALPLLQDKECRRQIERLLDSVICHDPSLELGSCPKNTSMSVNVGFQALKTGVFELGTHMKLNLRYALGNQSNLTSPGLFSPSVTSSDSNATISAEDQLALESENLWRDRSASICSGHSAEQNILPVTDKRKSFATKSYSFGELGPTGSGDSTEDSAKVRFKKIERSCAVPASRPTALRPALSSLRVGEAPVNTNLMDTGNFRKKHCLLYVPSR